MFGFKKFFKAMALVLALAVMSMVAFSCTADIPVNFNNDKEEKNIPKTISNIRNYINSLGNNPKTPLSLSVLDNSSE